MNQVNKTITIVSVSDTQVVFSIEGESENGVLPKHFFADPNALSTGDTLSLIVSS